MVQVRIEIVHGEFDIMIARRVAQYRYRVEMVEVMITNQDKFII